MENYIPVLASWAMVDDADEVPTVLNTVTGSIYLTNEVGVAIIGLVDGNRSTGEIARAIADSHSADYETAMSDAREFFDAAVDAGIISWRDN